MKKDLFLIFGNEFHLQKHSSAQINIILKPNAH